MTDALIFELQKLAESSDESDQMKMLNLMNEKLFDPEYFCAKHCDSKIILLLVKLLAVNNENVQERAAFIIRRLMTSSNNKEIATLFTEAGAIQYLMKLLLSLNKNIVMHASFCLAGIASFYPNEIVKNEAFPALIKHLKSEEVCCPAVNCFSTILCKCEQNVQPIIEAGGAEALMEILEKSDCCLLKSALRSFIYLTNSTTCQYLADCGVLNSLYNLFRSASCKKCIVPLLLDFINKFISFDVDQIDAVINADIVSSIISQTQNEITDEITIKSVEIIKSIAERKPDFVPTLITKHNAISLLSGRLENDNAEILVALLSTLNEIFNISGYDKVYPDFKHSGGLEKLPKLLENENGKVKELANKIFEFFDNKSHVLGKKIKIEASEINETHIENIEAPTTSRKRKRGSKKLVPKKKRSKKA